jgi:hypothetical protein
MHHVVDYNPIRGPAVKRGQSHYRLHYLVLSELIPPRQRKSHWAMRSVKEALCCQWKDVWSSQGRTLESNLKVSASYT